MADILSISFFILRFTGLWKPSNWNSPWLDVIHKIHMAFLFSMIYSFCVSGIIGIIQKHDDVANFINDCFILLSCICCCGKCANIVGCHKTIKWILKTLDTDPCAPRNQEEIEIQKKIDRSIWNTGVFYSVLTAFCVFMVNMSEYFQDIPIGTLLYNGYFPWNYDKGFLYHLAYNYQVFCVFLSANVAIAFDTFVPGLMMQVCAKMDILKLRFTKLADLLDPNLTGKSNKEKLREERRIVAEYVQFHLLVFKLSETINSTFNIIIFFQCSISTVVICTSVYSMARIPVFTSEFIGILLYLFCMLTEIFILCSAGDELTLVSFSLGDAIYKTDWTTLDTTTVKSLIIIMSRSLHPIIFQSGYFVTLSLDSFKSLIKMSYSIFNVLQQS